jgi:NADH-quinone oxidoreductase subunit J
MFAQQTDLRNYDIQMTNPWLAATISAILLATITMCVTEDQAFAGIRVDLTRPYSLADMPESFAAKPEGSATLPAAERVVPKKTSGLGRALYTDYLLAVELAGTVLLVATIGAIALAQRTTEGQS